MIIHKHADGSVDFMADNGEPISRRSLDRYPNAQLLTMLDAAQAGLEVVAAPAPHMALVRSVHVPVARSAPSTG